MISTILLLPHADTRERLLAPGVPVYIKMLRRFGWSVPDGWVDEAGPPRVRGLFDDWGCHLVLARSGARAYEGIDRVTRVADLPRADVEVSVADAIGAPGVGAVLRQALSQLSLTVKGLGTLVLLDADNNEVSDV